VDEVIRPRYRVYIDWWWKEDPLILHLKFDESYGVDPDQQGSALTLFDLSKYESSVEGYEIYPAKGRFGQGFWFGGQNSRIRIPNDPRFNLTDDFSIEMRFEFLSYPPDHDLFLYGKPSSFAFRIPWEGGRPELAIYDGESWWIRTMDYYPEAETLIHLLVVRRRIEEVVEFWFNGELVSSLPLPGWVEPLFLDEPIFIGGTEDSDNSFEGIMDEVRIYSKALSPLEIQQRWKGVTADVLSFAISRGKSEELGGSFVAGQFSLDLENASGRYSPENTSSDLYPLIDLNKPVYFEAEWQNVFLPLFTGYIDRITPHPALGQRRTYIGGRDRFKDLIGQKISTPAYSDQFYHELVEAVLQLAGWRAHEYEVEESGWQASFAAWRNEGPIEALEDIAAAGLHVHFIDQEGRYKFFNQGFYFENPYKDYDAFDSFDYDYSDQGVINSARIEAQPRYLEAETLIWQLTESFEINPGETKTLVCEYHDYNTGGRRYAESPAVASYSAQDEFGNSITLSLTITSSDASSCTLQVENASSATVTVTDIQINGRPFAIPPRIIAAVEDQTSVQKFFRRSYSLSNDLISSHLLAQDIAEWVVLRHKDPAKGLSISFRDRFPDVLHLDLGSLMRVSERITGIDDYYQIQALALKVASGGPKTTLEMELWREEKWSPFIVGQTPLGEGVLL
jgi:hypothetical protein